MCVLAFLNVHMLMYVGQLFTSECVPACACTFIWGCECEIFVSGGHVCVFRSPVEDSVAWCQKIPASHTVRF